MIDRQIVTGLAPYVLLEVAEAATGYSVKAMRRKIEEGIWQEGREWYKAPDGHVLISIEGYRKWVEQGPASRSRKNLSFVDQDGNPQRHTLTDDGGKPLPPTAANVKRAHRVAAEIREKVKHGLFVLSEYFSVNGGTVGAVTLGAQLDAWYGTLRKEHSTLAGYSSAIKFWKGAAFDREQPDARLGDRPLRW